jgi:MinD-like ATPase involved in chromosome partitioning or flagellar assembly
MEPKKWLNDYLLDTAEIQDIMIDLTPVVAKESADGGVVSGGKLWVAFCNPGKEEVYKMEGGKQEKVQLLRKFISLREQLFSRYEADYLIIDTSPGIRYWSINALAVADVLYLTLKAGDLDVAGTKKMASDIYGALSKFGGKPYLILNRVAGYCVPHTLLSIKGTTGSTSGPDHGSGMVAPGDSAGVLGQEYGKIVMQNQETSNELSKAVGIDVAIALPCYCDIQFSKKEFLTVLHDPQHPFAKMIENLAQKSKSPGGN